MESMAKTDKGEAMTYWYDLERLSVTLEQVENAARDMECNHDVADWLAHRLSHIRAEARSFKDAITLHKRENHV